jgi:hypothetical protein
MFPYAMLSCHEDRKRNTITIAGRISAKLPHCTNHVLTYLMENEMSLVHHIMEQWGYNYTNKDNKSLSERTR